MGKIYKKLENWIWIIALIGALVYFHWLLGNFHVENENLQEAQKEFSKEIGEKYEQNKQLQSKIQAQLNKLSEELLQFLQLKKSSKSFYENKFDPSSD